MIRETAAQYWSARVPYAAQPGPCSILYSLGPQPPQRDSAAEERRFEPSVPLPRAAGQAVDCGGSRVTQANRRASSAGGGAAGRNEARTDSPKAKIKSSGNEPIAMKFGIHHSSWLDRPDPAEAFEAVKAKARWAEDQGFVWFSVLDHMIQIPRVGAPDEPFWKAGPSWQRWPPSPAVFVSPPFARRLVIAIPRISPRSRRASI